jgi:hypothetical protein
MSMRIEFSGEAHDSEWKALSGLLGYNVRLTYDSGRTEDVRLLSLEANGEGIRLRNRKIDDNGEPFGPEKISVPADVYVY